MSFHEKFESFREEFGKERSLIVALSSVNSKATNDLKSVYVDLLNSCCQLSRLHYIAHSTHDFTIDELAFPLKGIQHLSVSTSIRLFQKPNHKDRFTYLVYYLREHSDIFAQIIYFSLLTPNNRTLHIPDISLFSEDDSVYFCYMTFPAIYNYFLTHNDQMSAISFITKIFSLHMSIHGSNFSKPHKFLSSLVSSLFLATNPGQFFEASVAPLVRMYGAKIEEKRYEYYKEGNVLVRWLHWKNITDFAYRLLTNMMKNAPLMPTAARFLITKMLKVKTDHFPFKELFIIDAMICDFLENHLLTDDTTLMRDVCNVIRCCYPQRIIPSPIFSTIKIVAPDFPTKVKLNVFINAFKLEKIENDPLTAAIQACEEQTLFTPRDLTLIHNSIALFLKFADPSKVSDLANSFSGLSPPTSNADDRILCLKTWNNSVGRGKTEIKPTRDFDEIVDCLSSINMKKMIYNSTKDLSQNALLYCGSSLGWMQKLRIDNLKPEFENDLSQALDTVRENKENLSGYSDQLFTALFSITSEFDRNTVQIKKLLRIFVKAKLLPFMNEIFPHDFDFGNADLSHMPSAELFPMLIKMIDNHIARLSLPKVQESTLRKRLMIMYLDQLENIHNIQYHKVAHDKTQLTSSIGVCLSKLTIQENSQNRLSTRILSILRLIHPTKPPSINLENILLAMNLMKNLSDEEILKAFATSKNISIFGLLEFIQKFYIDETVKGIVFTREEEINLRKFIHICNQILK
ncbi:hypothetical protein TRFO_38768 [Tritrichomonas foetus]|uniref:Uncharacterized protein n=1 Tax=Tritrichomonas foetus TaxID=1144522 RepID=A0A1J4JCC0_9EUKA|nr:hypothetical protein TRFO_38768 [Tritrichomonas foetus]|eukprot:OHS95053.1 hypothetical protein TRFO_38768 [Tritrichomonas foetus]